MISVSFIALLLKQTLQRASQLMNGGEIMEGSENGGVTTSSDLLYIGTLVAHRLLSHLEAPRSELRRPHLLSAVALPLAGGLFGYRLVTHNLCDEEVRF